MNIVDDERSKRPRAFSYGALVEDDNSPSHTRCELADSEVTISVPVGINDDTGTGIAAPTARKPIENLYDWRNNLRARC